MYEINEMLLRRKNKVNLPKRSVKHEARTSRKSNGCFYCQECRISWFYF